MQRLKSPFDMIFTKQECSVQKKETGWVISSLLMTIRDRKAGWEVSGRQGGVKNTPLACISSFPKSDK